jgi:type VI secretion system protein ImpL
VNGAPPALDAALQALGSLHAKLAEAAISPDPAAAFARIGPTGAAQLAQAAQGLPAPLAGMLQGIAKKAEAISSSGIRARLDAIWRSDVLPFCRTAIGGRYPFSPGSRIDASLDDTARLLAPGGLIDGFVKNQLAPFVDTAQRPWRDLQAVGLSPASLAQLDRAERISSSLFAAGAKPSAGFTLTPLDLDAGAASVTLDIDGQQLHYAHGPAQPTAFTWPGPSGANLVRLSFAPLDGSAPASEVEQGPWGLFRLLQRSRLRQQGQPDLFAVTLAAGGHSVSFALRASSVDNPFNTSLLVGFSCPEGL